MPCGTEPSLALLLPDYSRVGVEGLTCCNLLPCILTAKITETMANIKKRGGDSKTFPTTQNLSFKHALLQAYHFHPLHYNRPLRNVPRTPTFRITVLACIAGLKVTMKQVGHHSQCVGHFFAYLFYSRVEPTPFDAPKPAGHTRFVCVSDTHSRTDGIQMPDGDVLLHTGDFSNLGLPSEVKKFSEWLGKGSCPPLPTVYLRENWQLKSMQCNTTVYCTTRAKSCN